MKIYGCYIHVVFCTCWLRNVLCATTARTFSTSQLPKMVRTWGVFCFLLKNVLRATTACTFSSLIWPDGSAPAALASLLFGPPEPQIIGKTQCAATFLPFGAPASSFFWLFLFYSSLFYSSLLSDSSHLCFSSVHVVGSLTTKLPSMIVIFMFIYVHILSSSHTFVDTHRCVRAFRNPIQLSILPSIRCTCATQTWCLVWSSAWGAATHKLVMVFSSRRVWRCDSHT